MRVVVVLLALAIPVSGWAQASSAPVQLLNDEAGESAELGASLCGVPPATITAFKAKLDVLQPGTTQSADFRSAAESIRQTMNKLRANGDTMSEFRDTNCELAKKRIDAVLASRTP